MRLCRVKTGDVPALIAQQKAFLDELLDQHPLFSEENAIVDYPHLMDEQWQKSRSLLGKRAQLARTVYDNMLSELGLQRTDLKNKYDFSYSIMKNRTGPLAIEYQVVVIHESSQESQLKTEVSTCASLALLTKDLHKKGVPVVYPRLKVELLKELGVPEKEILSGTDLTMEALAPSKEMITWQQELTLNQNVVRLSPREDIGLLSGLMQRLHHHGVYGYAIMSSATLEQALRTMVRFIQMCGEFLTISLEITDSHYQIKANASMPLGSVYRFMVDELITGILTALEQVTDGKFRYDSISLDLPRPNYAERYESLCKCPVHFDSDSTVLSIDRAIGSMELDTWDPHTAEVCTQRCAQVLNDLSLPTSFVDQVHQCILKLPCHKRQAEQVADLLEISPRHLRRKLNAADTSFKAVLDRVRKELARDYLTNSSLSIEEIAPLLGFTETTNFRRAFKRWTEISPTEFRKQIADSQ